jgi:formate dehydrogenase subunit beta
MSEKIEGHVSELLKQGKIRAFVGLKKENGQIIPHLFTDATDLDGFYTGNKDGIGAIRYPLNKVLVQMSQKYPDAIFGILVRGCDERGLKELYKWNQLNPEFIVPVGLACPKELAEVCECIKPYPDAFIDGEQVPGIGNKTVEKVNALKISDRFIYWLENFSRCIKCYGCRNICPMCFCNECSLEDMALIETGRIPPESPIFHLTRAVHMAGRCIDCGLCEEACPVDIPLRTLYKKVAEIIEGHYSYRPGYDEKKSPLNILGPRPEDN